MDTTNTKNKSIIKKLLIILLFFIPTCIICSSLWAKNNFVFKNFEVLLFTITNPIGGTDRITLLKGFFFCGFIPLLISIILYIIINLIIKKFNLNKKLITLITLIILFIFSILFSIFYLGIDKYIKDQFNKTTLYEEKYVDPKTVNYTFPDKKRNLIFIYLESMETSFYDKSQGGALKENVIPELYDLSLENITFTDSNNQGYYSAPGATWTIASNVASTSGLPLKINTLMPGAFTLGDVLHNGGYINEVLMGSDGNFADTNIYFENHGKYIMKDYNYAINWGWIPEGFKENWGVADSKLLDWAKEELVNLSKENKPFNLTLSTIDAHLDGFVCDKCVDYYGWRILNTLRCTSKQISEFIKWIKQQDFYNNTTIVIMGDHVSMSGDLKELINEDEYVRKCYFTIINPAIEYTGKTNRLISTFDIYPTTLAAMGIKFDSDRLGLGTNLYSNTPTLLEEMGNDFFKEVEKSSDYYINKIIK